MYAATILLSYDSTFKQKSNDTIAISQTNHFIRTIVGTKFGSLNIELCERLILWDEGSIY